MENIRAKVILVGAGRMGEIRAGLIHANPRAELSVVVEPDEGRGMALAQKYGATWSMTLDKAVEAESGLGPIPCVWVATGTSSHKAIIELAAQHGMHVFCEKPIDDDPNTIGRLFDICERAGTHLCCGFQRRFDESFVAARSKVQTGDLGKITMVRSFFADHPCPSMEFLRSGGDPFMDLAPHDVDFVNWILNDEPLTILGAATSSTEELSENNVFDTANISLQYCKGTLVNIMMSRGSTYGYDQRVEIFGTKGMVTVGNPSSNELHFFSSSGVQSSKSVYSFQQRYHFAFAEEVDRFLDTVLLHTPWPIRGFECARTQEICQLASRSAMLGNVVSYKSLTPRTILRPVGRGAFGIFAAGIWKCLPSVQVLEPFSSKTGEWSEQIDSTETSALYIASPDDMHTEHAIWSLQAGKHCFVEKPLKPDFDAVEQVWLKARRIYPNIALMVGFQRRYHDQFLAARAISLRCPVSRVTVISSDPVDRVDDMTFVLYNSVCHDIDIILWLFPNYSLEVDSVDIVRQVSGITLKGQLQGASSIPFEVRYCKRSTSYVQNIILETHESEKSSTVGHVFGTKEFYPKEGGDPFCSVYSDAYRSQFTHFLRICEFGESEESAVERIKSYSRTFSTLLKIATRPEFN